jgi:hypothetical protein
VAMSSGRATGADGGVANMVPVSRAAVDMAHRLRYVRTR